MLWIVTAPILFIFAIAAYLFIRAENNAAGTKYSPAAGFLAVMVLLGIFTAFCSTTSVAPRSVGVATAFGKPVQTFGNGLHLKAPWWKVTDLDGSVQNNIYNGGNQIGVRLANNSQAKVDASIQWQLRADDTLDLFLDYRDIDTIQSNVIDRNLRSAINEVMATYDPLNAKNPAEGGKDLSKFEADVLQKMKEKVGDKVDIKSVTLPIINFDQSTQDRINELQSETAKTRIAEQSKATAQQEAEANKKLEQSITDQTLTSKCLDIVKEKGGSPYGCFPESQATAVKKID